MTTDVEPGGLLNAQDDLRSTSESIKHDAARLHALEAEKSSLDVSDPRAAVLAREVEQLSRNLTQKAMAQRALVDEIQDR